MLKQIGFFYRFRQSKLEVCRRCGDPAIEGLSLCDECLDDFERDVIDDHKYDEQHLTSDELEELR